MDYEETKRMIGAGLDIFVKDCVENLDDGPDKEDVLKKAEDLKQAIYTLADNTFKEV